MSKSAVIGWHWPAITFNPRYTGWLASWISPLALLLAWVLVCRAQWFPEQILVSPQDVADSARDLWSSGDLQDALRVSLYRLALGFSLGSLLGIAAGALLAHSETARIYFSPTFNALRQVPTLALTPLFILIFGIGETLKIVIILKATFFPVAIATREGVRSIPRQYLEVGEAYCLSSWQQFRRIIFPATVPAVLTGIRIALGRSWMILVAVELLAADSGIGQIMEMGRQMLRIDQVMVGVFLTGLIGFSLDRSLRLLERWLLRWRHQG